MGRLKSFANSAVGSYINVSDRVIKDAWELYVEEGGAMPLEEFSRLFLAFTYGIGTAGLGRVL